MKVYAKILTLVVFACSFMLFASIASAAPGWRYKSSHGMANCEFAAPSTPGASVNGGTVSGGAKSVTISAQVGSTVTLRLICKRDQSYNASGDLESIGPVGNYSSDSLGSGTEIGVDKPGDSSSGYEMPKGREWIVPVASTSATYNLSWNGNSGSDSIAVTVQPIDAPASQADVREVKDMAETAMEGNGSDYGAWERRIVSVTANYQLDLDSFGDGQAEPSGAKPDARQGWGLDIDAFVTPKKSSFKLDLGVTFDMKFRQVPTTYAPNLPANGFNAFTDGKSYFVGPKVGGSLMPTSWFEFRFWASPGVLLSVWDTIPISQLPDRTLYSGESDTHAAFGYKARLEANFIIADHFLVGPSIGIEGNISELPVARGAMRDTNGALVLREGHWIDVPLTFNVGAIF